jgi:glycerophosphoryl diester phosphodiesterase
MAAPRDFLKRVRKDRPEALIWPPLKIGQRGAPGEAPENTLASFELALEEGAEGIALDVQLSSDGIPVVISGDRLSRATPIMDIVHTKQASTLIQLDVGSWFNRRFPSRARRKYVREPIPLLFEVLHWIREKKCMALIAIHRPTPEAEIKVLKEIDRVRVHHLTRVIARDLAGLQRLRRMDPEVNLGLRMAGRTAAIQKARALGAEVLLPRWTLLSPSLVRRAHRASMLVIPWTINSLRQMRRTLLEGVDGIITNYPATLNEAVASLQKTSATAKAKRVWKKGSGQAKWTVLLRELAAARNSSQPQFSLRSSTSKEML